MSQPKNVQIPYKTFLDLLETLEYIDTSTFAADFQIQFEDVLEALQDKKRSLDRRDAYTAYKTAQGHQRDEKRIEYMKLKDI